jgi:hypothetical protein
MLNTEARDYAAHELHSELDQFSGTQGYHRGPSFCALSLPALRWRAWSGDAFPLAVRRPWCTYQPVGR